MPAGWILMKLCRRRLRSIMRNIPWARRKGRKKNIISCKIGFNRILKGVWFYSFMIIVEHLSEMTGVFSLENYPLFWMSLLLQEVVRVKYVLNMHYNVQRLNMSWIICTIQNMMRITCINYLRTRTNTKEESGTTKESRATEKEHRKFFVECKLYKNYELKKQCEC